MKDVIPAGFFADAVNPTDEEIVRWAYIEGTQYPPEMPEDWDLCVTEPNRRDLFLRLACDDACPNRKFFLSCLYLLIGDSMRSSGKTWRLEEAVAWVAEDRCELPEDVALFFARAKRLLTGREKLDYDKWCSGGYAYGTKQA